jgi:hypothetical protein
MKKFTKKIFNVLLTSALAIPVAFSDGNLSGTSWVITDDDGHQYIHRFNADGTCPYFKEKSSSGNQGKLYDNCKWFQNGDVVVFEVNNFFAVRSGIVNVDRMNGFHVSNWHARMGTFVGKRQ